MDKRTYLIEVLTPVHIGSHEGAFTTYDYVLRGGNLYVIHQGKLAEFLDKRQKIEDFTREVEKRGKNFDIGNFLDSLGVTESHLKEMSRYSISAEKRKGLRQLQPHIRDARGRDYIPGSSIKGAMRTAYIYKSLKTMREERRDEFKKFIEQIFDVVKKMNSTQTKKKRRDRWLFKKLEQELMQGFTLCDSSDSPSYSPNKDVLRCLHVTDAYPLESRVAAINAKVLDKTHDYKFSEESPLYLEAIVSGTYRFEISWDEWLAGQFLDKNRNNIKFEKIFPSGIQDIVSACREFVTDQIKKEEEFFGSCLGGERIRKSLVGLEGRANFRLGWGSGLIGASISMLLPESLKQKIRNTYPLFSRYDRRVKDFPKSRRVVFEGQLPTKLMGFCCLREISGS